MNREANRRTETGTTKRVRAQSFDFFYLHRNTFLFASQYFFYLHRNTFLFASLYFFYLHRNTSFICIAILLLFASQYFFYLHRKLFYLQRFFFICSVSFLFAVCPLWAIVEKTSGFLFPKLYT